MAKVYTPRDGLDILKAMRSRLQTEIDHIEDMEPSCAVTLLVQAHLETVLDSVEKALSCPDLPEQFQGRPK